ncbi:MAG: MFS transporter [Dehalococcoidia bacterium]|nr:MFS transporter [Dehalococcoidia bacterium]
MGGILLAGMIATLFLVREKPARPHARPSLISTLIRTFNIDPTVRRDFLWFLGSRLLVLMAPKTLLTYAFFYLGDVVGASNPAEAIGDVLLALGISMLATVHAAAHVSDWLGRKPVLLGSGIVGIVGICLLLFAGSYPAVLAAAALLGASSGSFLGTNWALATDLVSAGEEGRYMGLTNIATAGAGALAIPLMGPVIDFFNSRSPGQGYTAMLIACALYIAVGTVLVLRVKVKRRIPVGNQEAGETA